MTLRPPDFPSVAVTDYYLGTLTVTLPHPIWIGLLRIFTDVIMFSFYHVIMSSCYLVTDYYLGTLSVTLAASPHLDNLRLVIGLP